MARKKKKKYPNTQTGQAEKAWDELWKEKGKERITLLSGVSSKVRIIVLELTEYPWAEAGLKEGQEGLLFKTTDNRVRKGSEILYNGIRYQVTDTRNRSDYIYIAEILATPTN